MLKFLILALALAGAILLVYALPRNIYESAHGNFPLDENVAN